jgi:alcohol dehydrogenase class IV
MHMFNTVSRVVVGEHCCANIAQVLASIVKTQVERVLLVSDEHLLGFGLLAAAMAGLKAAGIEVFLYTDVQPDPPEALVLACVDYAKSNEVEAVIAIGGGSSMDVAKVVALLASSECRQPIAEMYGVDQAQGERLPLLLAPTTAGTGSEVTAVAIITTGETTKAGIVSPLLYADVALLDASMTASLPAHICAATAIDSMVHAIEAYTSKVKKNPLSDQLALSALQLLADNIVAACQPNASVSVRENMLIGAMQAGQAFANAPVAAIHALAYPLGGHYHISHGLSNALVMPHVMAFNIDHCAPLYAELARYLKVESRGSADRVQAQALVNYLSELMLTLKMPVRLRDCKVTQDSLEMLATDAMLQTRLLINNPREVTFDDALAIYKAAY